MSHQPSSFWAPILSALSIMTAPATGQDSKRLPDPGIQRADDLYNARDYATALPLYRKAAEAGRPHAMMRLGFSYDLGQGVKTDYAEAMRWYRRAAELGDTEAMAYIGGLYAHGDGVPVDQPQALSWYHKSADAGGAAGMNKLGLAYQNGIGVQKNPTLALQWYIKAADLGDMYAMNNLGNMYLGNAGIRQNQTEALRWYRKAAELGETDSMNELATVDEIGWGKIPKNLKEAEYWFRKSAALGNENGRQSMMRIGGWQNFNLNGDWEAYFTSPALPEAIRIVQHDDTLQATRLRDDLSPLGLAFLRATYDRTTGQGQVDLAAVGLLGLI